MKALWLPVQKFGTVHNPRHRSHAELMELRACAAIARQARRHLANTLSINRVVRVGEGYEVWSLEPGTVQKPASGSDARRAHDRIEVSNLEKAQENTRLRARSVSVTKARGSFPPRPRAVIPCCLRRSGLCRVATPTGA